MSSGTVNRTVNIFIESGDAQKAYDKLVEKQKKLSDEIAKSPKNVEELRKELAQLEEPISRAAKKLSGELSPSMKDLQGTVKNLSNQLKRMSQSDADYSKVLKQYAQAKADLSAMQQEVKKVEKAHQDIANTNPFGRIIEFAKGAFAGGALLNVVQGAIGSITDFIKSSFDEAFQAEENAARLKSTLDNLGRSDAFDRLTAKANELAEKFKFLDNDDINEAFNKLITYGKLTEKQMTDLMPVIIDFAAKQRISIGESTDVITKAMEGNAKALKTYGINIKDGSTTTERFNIVMTELKQKVDGAGEAFMNTAAGGVAVTKQQFANLKEEIGTQLLPVLNKVLSVIGEGIKGISFLFGSVKGAAEQEIGRQSEALFKEQIDKRVEQAQNAIKSGKVTLDQVLASNELAISSGKLSESEIRIRQAAQVLLSATKLGTGDTNEATGKIEKLKKSLEDLQKQREKATDDKSIASLNKQIKETQDEITRLEGGTVKLSKAENKAASDLKELREELKKIATSLLPDDTTLQKLEKENQTITDHYDKLREKAHGNAQLLKQIESLEYEERLRLLEKFEKEYRVIIENNPALRLTESNAKAIKALGDHLADAANRLQASFTNDSRAHDSLALMQKTGEDLLEEQIRQLHDQRDNEIANTVLTEQGKEDVRRQYELKEEELRRNFQNQRLQQEIDFAKQALDIYSIFAQSKTDKENAELEHDRKINDQKKKNLDDRLKKGVLSQQQYDREVAKIDKAQEKREKEIKTEQFKRNQKAMIVQALMNGAMAVTSTIAAIPGPHDIVSLGILRALQIGLMIATTAAQVTTIAKQKPPEYARGGKLSGNLHSAGGMGVYDQFGRKQAEVEGGEAVVNRFTMGSRNRYSVTGTPSQIISELNGLYGSRWTSGATMQPVWRNARPVAMNFAGIPKRFFADGGVFGGTSNTNASDNSTQTMAMVMDVLTVLTGTVGELQRQLQNGIVARTYLTQQEAQQDRLDNIRKDATLKG